MERRNFLKKMTLGTIGAGLLTAGYSWQIEPYMLEFSNIQLPINNLPDHLVGKTLMQISDVHVGNMVDSKYLIESFNKAQSYNPDFVVYTGDYVHWENDKQYKQIKKVFQHAVRGRKGTAGILGNHDYGDDWIEQDVADNICDLLENAGIDMLVNEQITYDDFSIIGIDDFWGPHFNPAKSLEKYNPNNANIVLSHNPDSCDEPGWGDYKGWVLSGHTHGGQCKVPGIGTPILPVKNKKYASGAIDLEDGRKVYINRALGHLYHVRFNVRPEITIFSLERA